MMRTLERCAIVHCNPFELDVMSLKAILLLYGPRMVILDPYGLREPCQIQTQTRIIRIVCSFSISGPHLEMKLFWKATLGGILPEDCVGKLMKVNLRCGSIRIL